MSRKKRTKPERSTGRQSPRPANEKATADRQAAESRGGNAIDTDEGASSRAAEAMTVAWMLSFMASILGEAGTLISAGLLLALGQGKDTPGLLTMIPGVLWFVSIVTGTCCLVLTVVVCRIRAVTPPVNLVRAAVVVGLFPWLAILLTWAAR